MVEPRSGACASFLKAFETRLLDMDTQTQISDIQDMDKFRTYKLLKLNFGCGEYMFVMLSCTSVC